MYKYIPVLQKKKSVLFRFLNLLRQNNSLLNEFIEFMLKINYYVYNSSFNTDLCVYWCKKKNLKVFLNEQFDQFLFANKAQVGNQSN